MARKVLITGNSSGLGYGLSEACLLEDDEVYGLSRRGYPRTADKIHDVSCDLEREEQIAPALDQLLQGEQHLDLVFLNAGIFGELTRIRDISLQQLERIMKINVWANKFVIDWLFEQNIKVDQVIAISSGAAVSANKGWGCYSLSKIALNKLMELYATEYYETHFTSLAPGLVDTAMQDYLCDDEEERVREYPLLEKFRQARGTDVMPQPLEAAQKILAKTSYLLSLASGTFVDIRKI